MLLSVYQQVFPFPFGAEQVAHSGLQDIFFRKRNTAANETFGQTAKN